MNKLVFPKAERFNPLRLTLDILAKTLFPSNGNDGYRNSNLIGY